MKKGKWNYEYIIVSYVSLELKYLTEPKLDD